VLLLYADAVDIISAAILLVTWCVDPGEPASSALDTGVDTGFGAAGTAAGAIPDPSVSSTAGAALGIAATAVFLGLALKCFGLPGILPLFLLSPCLLVPLAHFTAFATAGLLLPVALTLLPAGGDVAGSVGSLALGTARDESWDAYQDVVGCRWLTLPPEVRNPQPTMTALDVFAAAQEQALAEVWPAYDQARGTAFGAVDAAFGADQTIPNPDGIPAPPEAPEAPVEPPGIPPGVPPEVPPLPPEVPA
jgi:hypothetical protein